MALVTFHCKTCGQAYQCRTSTPDVVEDVEECGRCSAQRAAVHVTAIVADTSPLVRGLRAACRAVKRFGRRLKEMER